MKKGLKILFLNLQLEGKYLKTFSLLSRTYRDIFDKLLVVCRKYQVDSIVIQRESYIWPIRRFPRFYQLLNMRY